MGKQRGLNLREFFKGIDVQQQKHAKQNDNKVGDRDDERQRLPNGNG